MARLLKEKPIASPDLLAWVAQGRWAGGPGFAPGRP